jgi:predicted metal-binding membrane protein
MTVMLPSTPEQARPHLATRDRLVVLPGLGAVGVLAWIYLFLEAARMQAMTMADVGTVMVMKPWNATDLLLLFLMWVVMMVAMMLPSVSTTVLTYAAVVRRISPQQPAGKSTAGFVGDYVLAWALFSVLATGLQWGLERLALLSPAMVNASPVFGGLVLIAAGLYQWSPFKQVCLTHCQAPLTYLAQHWRQGAGGAVCMGLHHGLYCIGCCWALMALLFVGGVMNRLWVAAIAFFVLLEKLALLGGRTGLRLSGLAAVAVGIAFIVVGL